MKKTEDFFLEAFVDTFDIRILYLNETELSLLIKYSKNYFFEYSISVTDILDSSPFMVVLTINPNTLFRDYKKVLTVNKLNALFHQIIKEILFVLKREPLIYLTRTDLCFDSRKNFDDNFSVLYQIFRGLIQKANLQQSSNLYSILDVKAQKKRSLKAKNKFVEITCYDKADESKFLHDCTTRVEIRKKFLDCRITPTFDFSEVIQTYFTDFFSYEKEIFFQTNTNLLLEFIKVIEKNKALKFSSFFQKHKDYLNNYSVMQEIAEIYKVKDFKCWRSKYARETISIKYQDIELFFLEFQKHTNTFLEK